MRVAFETRCGGDSLFWTVILGLLCDNTYMFESRNSAGDVQSLLKRLFRKRNNDDDDDGDADDLDASTATLLSILTQASVVVGENDEVIRSNPSAYSLGVVRDDTIINDTVLAAVHDIRVSGGKRQFNLTTNTPKRDTWTQIDAHSQKSSSQQMQHETSVSRPNWLKVTVGRIDKRFVVVLIDDISESIRFSQVRDSFITNVSEQLLKPTQELEKLANSLEHDQLDEAAIRQDARVLRTSYMRMSHMMADLLLLIRAQEPVTATEDNKVSVMDQLRAAIQEIRPQAEMCDVRVRLEGDESLMAHDESDQIRIAVIKLLDNAIVYSPQGSEVSISALASDDGHDVVIRVIDLGCGIARSEQSRIFERFYRGNNQNERSTEGIGLGLAIVKHVALTHHGNATVWSSPGQGSTFNLILPAAV